MTLYDWTNWTNLETVKWQNFHRAATVRLSFLFLLIPCRFGFGGATFGGSLILRFYDILVDKGPIRHRTRRRSRSK